MSEISDAVQGTVADLFGDAPDATTEDAQPEAVAAAPDAEVETVELPDWEAAGRDLFAEDPDDEPDFAALAEEEVAEGEDTLTPSEYDDDQTRELKKQLAAERKKAEHFQRRAIETARRSWEADISEQPWAEFAGDLSKIKATSHRDFKRQAKAQARANYEIVKPHYEKLKAERERLAARVTTEARAEVQAAWGRPTVGGSQVPLSAEQRAANDLDRARKRRDIYGATKAMIDEGLI